MPFHDVFHLQLLRYVIQTADLDDVLEVGQTTWSPNFKVPCRCRPFAGSCVNNAELWMFGYVSILCLCLHLVSAGQAVPMRNGRDPKSAAEQVNEKLLDAREQKLIARDMVNVIEAWKARLGLRWYREI